MPVLIYTEVNSAVLKYMTFSNYISDGIQGDLFPYTLEGYTIKEVRCKDWIAPSINCVLIDATTSIFYLALKRVYHADSLDITGLKIDTVRSGPLKRIGNYIPVYVEYSQSIVVVKG